MEISEMEKERFGMNHNDQSPTTYENVLEILSFVSLFLFFLKTILYCRRGWRPSSVGSRGPDWTQSSRRLGLTSQNSRLPRAVADLIGIAEY